MASEQHLSSGLKVRHLTMMGLGSAIGAGLFLGTGQGIKAAGPAVLVSYMVAGLLVIMLMRMLAEMASAMPSSGAFSMYAEIGIGRWAGFTMGWLYWIMLVMVLGVEITGASQIVHGWLPGVPQWLVALVVVAFFAVVNLSGVRSFGEFEFWFAAIKVAAIGAFLVVGVLLLTGVVDVPSAVGITPMLDDGGFAPKGVAGIAAGLLAVVFAFGGIEIVTIAAAEAEDPQRSIARAAASTVWRILLFYIGSVAVMVLVLPWDSQRLLQGPFVAVLEFAGLEAAATIMEVVVVVALLSAFNANVYGTSRMIFSLSQRDDGAQMFLHVSRRGVPDVAVWTSIVFGLVSVALNAWLPDAILGILLNAVGASLLVMWVLIAVSELRLRPRLEEQGLLIVRMWGYPYLTWATIAGLGGVGVLMLFDETARRQLAATAGLVVVVVASYFVRRAVTSRYPARAPKGRA
ncbi:amino acid permease [Sanguibacter antarcticus]|uniref:Aromatic amino acid:proton symporter (AAT family) n=1 Tax=Sanguibacter antarcticus TaxID=372484 RepID=A0A2A9E3B1_9MICO|nr:amino acid permease [Sanguibacter antarcticus]PFG33428.1 aromatic amino acid:proton symporter (AAT family) [Sanguibacter antarcticus]